MKMTVSVLPVVVYALRTSPKAWEKVWRYWNLNEGKNPDVKIDKNIYITQNNPEIVRWLVVT